MALTTLAAIEAAIISTLAGLIEAEPESLNAETRLADVGVDSLMMIRLLLAIEREAGCWLPDEALNDETLESVGSLARRAYEEAQGAA